MNSRVKEGERWPATGPDGGAITGGSPESMLSALETTVHDGLKTPERKETWCELT